MESKMILIRHGLTEGNLKRWFYGGVDIPLAEVGIEALQKQAASGEYPQVPGDAQYFTSELQRTKQTLEILYGRHRSKALPLLNEMCFGEYECTRYEDMEGDPVFDAWINDMTGRTAPPGGESRQHFAARVSRGLAELKGLHQLKEWSHRHGGQSAYSVVVCHGGVIGTMMMELFPEKEGTLWDWIPDPGFGYTLDFSGRMDGVVTGYHRIGPAPVNSTFRED
ncbi:histidine phosphatase family protein [Eubacterium sp. AB3007]|jgi:alpha-ribazole phosphatase|uniref:histidine phosphatase family protein n=1 Tax=Eubacterium sp. AB3007 TaxID=1392487 RepID=UPI000482F465|nr:histidine phosphatase family protein [Eubacterium sp. AB3007]MBQ1471160.1 histidine phosphatase family protein [Eubacterium sp.]